MPHQHINIKPLVKLYLVLFPELYKSWKDCAINAVYLNIFVNSQLLKHHGVNNQTSVNPPLPPPPTQPLFPPASIIPS